MLNYVNYWSKKVFFQVRFLLNLSINRLLLLSRKVPPHRIGKRKLPPLVVTSGKHLGSLWKFVYGNCCSLSYICSTSYGAPFTSVCNVKSGPAGIAADASLSQNNGEAYSGIPLSRHNSRVAILKCLLFNKRSLVKNADAIALTLTQGLWPGILNGCRRYVCRRFENLQGGKICSR